MNRLVKTLALMLMGVAVWETLPARAQYPNYGASKVTVPLYGASYVQADNPPAQPPQAEDRLTRIEQKLDALALAVAFVVDAIKKAEAAEPVAAKGQGDPVIGPILQTCAKCHRSEAADKSGGGFAMFDAQGRFQANTARELRRIVSRINSPDPGFVMPPPKAGALTAEQKKALTALALADIQAQEAAKK